MKRETDVAVEFSWGRSCMQSERRTDRRRIYLPWYSDTRGQRGGTMRVRLSLSGLGLNCDESLSLLGHAGSAALTGSL